MFNCSRTPWISDLLYPPYHTKSTILLVKDPQNHPKNNPKRHHGTTNPKCASKVCRMAPKVSPRSPNGTPDDPPNPLKVTLGTPLGALTAADSPQRYLKAINVTEKLPNTHHTLPTNPPQIHLSRPPQRIQNTIFLGEGAGGRGEASGLPHPARGAGCDRISR